MAKVRDVVCDMMVDPEEAPAQTDYKAATFYFCSEECKEAFERNPEKYLLHGEEADEYHSEYEHHEPEP